MREKKILKSKKKIGGNHAFLLGCQYGKPSRGLRLVSYLFIFFFFFSVSVKVLPVTPLLSGVSVHRAFYAYFLRIERVVGNAYISLVDTVERLT